VLFGYGFLVERYFYGELTPEKIMKMAIIMTSMSIVMLVWYVWASKRQKRFERQLETLEKMAQQR
jgi:Flp pilus assembly protein TadB